MIAGLQFNNYVRIIWLKYYRKLIFNFHDLRNTKPTVILIQIVRIMCDCLVWLSGVSEVYHRNSRVETILESKKLHVSSKPNSKWLHKVVTQRYQHYIVPNMFCLQILAFFHNIHKWWFFISHFLSKWLSMTN